MKRKVIVNTREICLLLISLVNPENLFDDCLLDIVQRDKLKETIMKCIMCEHKLVVSTALWTITKVFFSSQQNPINLSFDYKSILTLLLSKANDKDSQIIDSAISVITFIYENGDKKLLSTLSPWVIQVTLKHINRNLLE